MSLKFSPRTPGRTRAQPRGLLTSCACCVFRLGASAAKTGVPRTGRRVQANSSILTCAVEIGQTETAVATLHPDEIFVISPPVVREFRPDSLEENSMLKRLLTVSLCLLTLTV